MGGFPPKKCLDKTVVHDNHEESDNDTQIQVESNTITEQKCFHLKYLRKRRVDILCCLRYIM